MEDLGKAQDVMMALVLSDHMGDVNHYIPTLCTLLGLPAPKWSDHFERYEMAWEYTETDWAKL